MSRPTTERIECTGMAIAMPAEQDALPATLQLMPWGNVKSARGDFVVNEESCRLMMEAMGAQGQDVVIDYEHQSLGGEYASPTGQAPAAGWIRLGSLREVVGQGIYADGVSWTPSARACLLAREYRYLSPVVIVRKSDRVAVGLDSVALTNRPAIAGLQPIVNKGGSLEEPDMAEDVKQQLEQANATLKQANAKVADLEKRQGLVFELLGLKPDAGEADIKAAVVALKNPTGMVPADQVKDLQKQLAESGARLAGLEAAERTRECETWVLSLVAAGKAPNDKLQAAAREYYLACGKDKAAAWAEGLPVLAKPGRVAPPTPEQAATVDRLALMRQTAEEYDKTAAQRVCSKAAAIQGALEEAKQPLASPEELAKVGA